MLILKLFEYIFLILGFVEEVIEKVFIVNLCICGFFSIN